MLPTACGCSACTRRSGCEGRAPGRAAARRPDPAEPPPAPRPPTSARSTRRSGLDRRPASTASCTSPAGRCPSWPASTAPGCSSSTRPTSAAGPRDFAAAFDGGRRVLRVQGLSLRSVARWIAEDGLQLDVCTRQRAGPRAGGGFPGRADRAARQQQVGRPSCGCAVDAGVGHVVLDSFDEIDRLVAAGRRAGRRGGAPVPVLVRATVGVEAHTHEFIATAHEDQKFGFSLASGDALTAAVRVLREPALQLAGLHSHIGSQIFDTAGFEVAAHRVVGLLGQIRAGDRRTRCASSTSAVASASPTCPSDDPVAPGDVARRLRAVVGRRVRRAGPAGPAAGRRAGPGHRRAGHGHALRDRHDQAGAPRAAPGTPLIRNYVSVDGGMSDNIRTALYDAAYTCGSPTGPRTRPPRCAGSWASTARAATSWSATCGCPPTSRRATCSPSPPPAPTAGRWPATTTTCSSRRSSRCGTASPRNWSGGRHCPTCSPSMRCCPPSGTRRAALAAGRGARA